MPAVQIAFDFDCAEPRRARPPARVGSFLAGIGEAVRARVTGVTRTPTTRASAAAPAESSETSQASPARAHLESALRGALDTPLRLTITDNRRTMISLRKRPDFTEIRLHHMFLTADAATVAALGRYVGGSDRAAGALLGRYIEGHRERIRRRVSRSLHLSTSGIHHDLCGIYADVNTRYFAGQVDAAISWGRSAGGKRRRSRRSIKLGSYCSRDRLIRVHPSLDAEFVPRFFLEYIVYHEMLHHVLPPAIRNGRRLLHDREFKQKERLFDDYALSLRWERENLDRLLGR